MTYGMTYGFTSSWVQEKLVGKMTRPEYLQPGEIYIYWKQEPDDATFESLEEEKLAFIDCVGDVLSVYLFHKYDDNTYRLEEKIIPVSQIVAVNTNQTLDEILEPIDPVMLANPRLMFEPDVDMDVT